GDGLGGGNQGRGVGGWLLGAGVGGTEVRQLPFRVPQFGPLLVEAVAQGGGDGLVAGLGDLRLGGGDPLPQGGDAPFQLVAGGPLQFVDDPGGGRGRGGGCRRGELRQLSLR